MSQIKPNQDFKHGRKTYKKGRKYEVSEEDGEYFANCGWVGDPGATIVKRGTRPDGTEWLDIHDAVIGHSSEVN